MQFYFNESPGKVFSLEFLEIFNNTFFFRTLYRDFKNKCDFQMQSRGTDQKTGIQISSGTLTGPYKNRKSRTQDPSGTLAGPNKTGKLGS